MSGPGVETLQLRTGQGGCLAAGLIFAGLATLRPMTTGDWPPGNTLLVLGSLGLFALGRPKRPAPQLQRFAALLALATLVTLGTLHWGWAPVVVLTNCLLVVLAALLGGKWPLAVLLVSEAALLLSFGPSVSSSLDPKVMQLLDPQVFEHWVRVALIYAVVATALFIVLGDARRVVKNALTTAQQRRATAAARLEDSRRTRQDRVAAVRRLRGVQRVGAVAQLTDGLARVLSSSLGVIPRELERLTESATQKHYRRASRVLTDAVMNSAAALRSLLKFSRQDDLPEEQIDLLDATREIVLRWGATLTSPLTLRVVGCAGLGVVISPQQLELLLVNLLLNASDALPTGGRCRVTVIRGTSPFRSVGEHGDDAPEFGERSETSWAELIVEDQGTGMGLDTLVSATDPFFSTKDERGHSGLGLTVVAGIAEQASGTLALESKVGVGTRVRVCLPIRSDTGPKNPSPRLLHGSLVTESRGPDPVEPSGAPRSTWDWESEIAQTIGRWGVVAVAAIFCSAALQGYGYQPFDMIGLATMTGAMVIAGWGRVVRAAQRVAALPAGIAIAVLPNLATNSFLAPTLLVGCVLAVTLAAMLSSAASSIGLIVFHSAALMAIGKLHDAQLIQLNKSLEKLSVLQADNWYRIGVSVPVASAILGIAVLGIVRHARAATSAAAEAARELEVAREVQEQETAQLLAFEREVSRYEKVCAANRVLAGVAHDLNNALQGLLISTEELDDDRLTQEQRDGVIRDLWSAHQYAEELVRRLRSTGASTTSSAERTPGVVDLGEFIRTHQPSLQALLGSDVSLKLELHEDCGVVMLRTELRRILENLLTNARDAMEQKGAVEIRIVADDEYAELAVTDSGRGMDAATLKKAFTPFFTTKPREQGTGLGLYALSQCVESAGGSVRVDSTPGRGSTFTVRLPRAPQSVRALSA